MNIQENTKKMSKFGMCQMNGDVVVVCNHTNAYIMINQHYIGIQQDDKHSKHFCKTI